MRKLELPAPDDLLLLVSGGPKQALRDRLLDQLSNLFVDLPDILRKAATRGCDAIRIHIRRFPHDAILGCPPSVFTWNVTVPSKYGDNLVATYLKHLMEEAEDHGYSVRLAQSEWGSALVYIAWQGSATGAADERLKGIVCEWQGVAPMAADERRKGIVCVS